MSKKVAKLATKLAKAKHSDLALELLGIFGLREFATWKEIPKEQLKKEGLVSLLTKKLERFPAQKERTLLVSKWKKELKGIQKDIIGESRGNRPIFKVIKANLLSRLGNDPLWHRWSKGTHEDLFVTKKNLKDTKTQRNDVVLVVRVNYKKDLMELYMAHAALLDAPLDKRYNYFSNNNQTFLPAHAILNWRMVIGEPMQSDGGLPVNWSASASIPDQKAIAKKEQSERSLRIPKANKEINYALTTRDFVDFCNYHVVYKLAKQYHKKSNLEFEFQDWYDQAKFILSIVVDKKSYQKLHPMDKKAFKKKTNNFTTAGGSRGKVIWDLVLH